HAALERLRLPPAEHRMRRQLGLVDALDLWNGVFVGGFPPWLKERGLPFLLQLLGLGAELALQLGVAGGQRGVVRLAVLEELGRDVGLSRGGCWRGFGCD